VLYDVTSSYLEGRCRELARFGYSRDGRPDRPQRGLVAQRARKREDLLGASEADLAEIRAATTSLPISRQINPLRLQSPGSWA
jgi:hypothetical protein